MRPGVPAGGPEWPDRNAGKAVWPSPPLFHEVQRFQDLWWWKLLIVLTAVALFGPLVALVLREILGGNAGFGRILTPQAMQSLAVGIFAGVCALFVLLTMGLETSVTGEGLHIRFRPFHMKPRFYPFTSIISAESVTYHPLRDYGGWGIRFGRMGWAYNIRGNRGVMLRFRDGKNLMVGSMKADELAEVLKGRIKRVDTA